MTTTYSTITDSTYGSSPVKRHRRTNAELEAIDTAIIAAVAEDNPVSLRGVYYRVVSAGAVPKTVAAYKLVGRQLMKLRQAGVVPYRHIVDGTRYVRRPTTFTDLEDVLYHTANTYRRALWSDQAAEVHIFTEKDAIVGVIDRVCREWDVPLGVLRGYCSESFAHEMGEVVSASKKPVFIYQLGDHDPSGIGAWEDFQKKVHRFAPSAEVIFERLAVTPEQITSMGLETRPTKREDPRAKNFDGESVEVDAIRAPILRQLVADAVVQHVDQRKLSVLMTVEEQEREVLTGYWRQNT